MIEADFHIDLHLHPTLKTSNWGKYSSPYTPWDCVNHIQPSTKSSKIVDEQTHDMAKFSQANFYKLIEGNVRVAFVSLYPIERGFFDVRNIPKILTTKNAKNELIAITAGIDPDRVNEYYKKSNYFKELNDEYHYIKTHEGKSPCKKYNYKIVSNYAELCNTIKNKNEIAVVITVEGCHALFDDEMQSGKMDKSALKKKLIKNIGEIKSWENPPFFMNLMHHFYNQLGGHAKSFKYSIGGTLLNQRKSLEKGLEGLGISVLKELLSNNNGKRILVDTKHMSLQARKEYYTWLKSFNHISQYEKIPIICSHSGVNGFKTMSGSLARPDSDAKNNKSYFFNWAINLSDEELNIIHQSAGIIGLIIDKGKLGGGAFLRELVKEKSEKNQKEMSIKIFLDNVFQVIKAINKKSAWDIIAFGSDFDGAINHLHTYDDATKIPILYKDLYEFLDHTKYEKKLWHGYKPEELLHKIFKQNAMQFLERNFK